MGFPCCQVGHCTDELENNRHRFCAPHRQLEAICSIVNCDAPVVPGTKACSDPEHAKMERLHFERGRAAFTLKDRLQKHRLAHPSAPADSSGFDEDDDGEEWYEVQGGEVRIHHEQTRGSIGTDDSVPCEASKENDKRKCKARWGRSRTHNEQLLVRPCGVIVQRATFYTAEAVSNVLVSLFLFLPCSCSSPRSCLYRKHSLSLEHTNQSISSTTRIAMLNSRFWRIQTSGLGFSMSA